MANTNYNICTNWGLHCFQQKELSKAVVLKCSMSRKNKETGEYSAPVYIDVYCSFEGCDIKQDDYIGGNINVDGQFSVGDYTNKQGEKVPTITIFATKVTKVTR